MGGACPFAPDSGFAHCCKEKDQMKCADKAALDLCKKKNPKASKAEIDNCAKGALLQTTASKLSSGGDGIVSMTQSHGSEGVNNCPFAPDSGFAHCCKEKDQMKCADKAAL